MRIILILLLLPIVVLSILEVEFKFKGVCEKEHKFTMLGQEYWCEPFHVIMGKHEQ